MDEQQLGRDDILSMAKLAGLHLPASYEDELVEAYEHVRRLVALLPSPARAATNRRTSSIPQVRLDDGLSRWHPTCTS